MTINSNIINGSVCTWYSFQQRKLYMYIEGRGRITLSSDSLPQNKSMLFYKNGDKYFGEVKNGLPDGEGRLESLACSTTYIGRFKEGDYQGEGVLQYTTQGMRIKGVFNRNCLEGTASIFFGDGTFQEVHIKKEPL